MKTMGRALDGNLIYGWAKEIFPICRSITGKGVRETLEYLKLIVPELEIKAVPSGMKAFDWEVPDEWNISDAFVMDENGKKVIDFKESNLHVIGYSAPVNTVLDLAELKKHIFTLPNQPDAIPYITSYYNDRWGFCCTQNKLNLLQPGKYKVFIDSNKKKGVLNYGEIILNGTDNREVFFSTYVCHPSMGNNEVSGPVLVAALAKMVKDFQSRKFTYRFVFIPETIGSIVYLSENIKKLKEKVYCGFNVTCVGDNRCYSFLPSRAGDTLSDKIAQHVLKFTDDNYKKYTWLDRGSDERQYCSPGVDLPIASIMRSKYHEYPEYHTSLDDLNLISPEGFDGSLEVYRKAILILESNFIPQIKCLGEPQLGKRGLYPEVSTKESKKTTKLMMDVISYSDGSRTLLDIAELIGVAYDQVLSVIRKLISADLISQNCLAK